MAFGPLATTDQLENAYVTPLTTTVAGAVSLFEPPANVPSDVRLLKAPVVSVVTFAGCQPCRGRVHVLLKRNDCSVPGVLVVAPVGNVTAMAVEPTIARRKKLPSVKAPLSVTPDERAVAVYWYSPTASGPL